MLSEAVEPDQTANGAGSARSESRKMGTDSESLHLHLPGATLAVEAGPKEVLKTPQSNRESFAIAQGEKNRVNASKIVTEPAQQSPRQPQRSALKLSESSRAPSRLQVSEAQIGVLPEPMKRPGGSDAHERSRPESSERPRQGFLRRLFGRRSDNRDSAENSRRRETEDVAQSAIDAGNVIVAEPEPDKDPKRRSRRAEKSRDDDDDDEKSERASQSSSRRRSRD